MKTEVIMKAIENLPTDGRNALEGYLEILIQRFVPEKKSEFFPVAETGELSPQIESYIEEEVERYLANPTPDSTLKELLSQIEKDLNIQIPDRINQSIEKINHQFGATLQKLAE